MCNLHWKVNSFPNETFRLFQTKFELHEHDRKFIQMARKHWKKEILLVSSDLSFFYSIFKRLVLQTHKKPGLFGKGLTQPLQH